jgi:predicted amidohydrolase
MLTVAVGQVEPVFGDVAGNVQRTAEVVARAAA